VELDMTDKVTEQAAELAARAEQAIAAVEQALALASTMFRTAAIALELRVLTPEKLLALADRARRSQDQLQMIRLALAAHRAAVVGQTIH
jgi:hypothetical protein